MEKNNFRKGVHTLMRRGMPRKAAVNKMRYYAATNYNKWIELSPQAAIYLMLIMAMAFLGANKESMSVAIKLFSGAITGMITSSSASGIAEGLNLGFLKQVKINIGIGHFFFSWRAFAVVTILIELWLFGWVSL